MKVCSSAESLSTVNQIKSLDIFKQTSDISWAHLVYLRPYPAAGHLVEAFYHFILLIIKRLVDQRDSIPTILWRVNENI